MDNKDDTIKELESKLALLRRVSVMAYLQCELCHFSDRHLPHCAYAFHDDGWRVVNEKIHCPHCARALKLL